MKNAILVFVLALGLAGCGAMTGLGVGAADLARMSQTRSIWQECVDDWHFTPSECDYAVAGLPAPEPEPLFAPRTYVVGGPALICQNTSFGAICN